MFLISFHHLRWNIDENVLRGLALEALITLLTVKFIPFFMLTWIISAFNIAFSFFRMFSFEILNSQCLRMHIPD